MFEGLPSTIRPLHYLLSLRTDLTQLKFWGQVDTTIRVFQETNLIRLNSLELNISDVLIKSKSKEDIVEQVKDVKLDAEKEEVHLSLERPLVKDDDYLLSMKFSGILHDKLRGYYRTELGPGGDFGGTCHFEATGARMAFPCWDEPKFRATFDVVLDVAKDKDLVTLSNMPEIKREPVEGNLKLSFYF